MINWRWIILIIIVCLLQVGLLPIISAYVPNLIILLVITFTLLEKDILSLWLVALGGIMLDLFSSLPFGIYALQGIFIFVLLRFLIRPIIHKPPFSIAAGIFLIISALTNLLFLFIQGLSVTVNIAFLLITETVIGGLIYYFFLHQSWNRSIIRVR